jgi:DNA-binding SARP family transcriptional activator
MQNSLTLFGTVALTTGAAVDATSTRRASQQRRIALLALLAAAPGESVSRDRLMGFLWPDRDERSARHLLADSLYIMRGALGDGAIVATAETLRLSSEHVRTDVVAFRTALAEQRWADALTLYRGDFLDGFFLRDAADFDQWATVERTRLRGLAARAALALADELHAAGRLRDAADAGERALELEPCDETLLRDLVRRLIAAGNPSRAEVVGRAFIERLDRELGVSPSAETMQVLREARAPKRPARNLGFSTAALVAQGRYHWHQRTWPAVQRAIGYFTRAVESNDRDVDAWCGLADSWIVLGGRAYVPVGVAVKNAAAAAARALSLDDTRGSAHTSIGGVHMLDGKWRDAESELRAAIQIDAGSADAHHFLSLTLLTGFGAGEEALREQTIAADLNPVSPVPVGTPGWQRYLRGEYELSRSSMEPAVDLGSDFEEGHAGLARAAARLGDESTVMTTIAAGLARRSDLRGDLLAEQASALAILGEPRRGRELAREATRHPALPLNLALAWASLGEAEQALRYLARDSFRVYWAPQAVWWDPRFDLIRGDRRFGCVLERIQRVWSPEWT